MKILDRWLGRPRENAEEKVMKEALDEKLDELEAKTSELRETLKKALAKKEIRDVP